MDDLDYCPSCGDWDVRLVDEYGWCAKCVTEHNSDIRVCPFCYNTFPASSNRKNCSTCKSEAWLTIHADRIEEYLLVGYSFTSAKQQVIHDIRPDCVICDLPILGGNPTALFCTRTKVCRSAQRRYKTNQENGMSKEEAVQEAINRKRGFNGGFTAASIRV